MVFFSGFSSKKYFRKNVHMGHSPSPPPPLPRQRRYGMLFVVNKVVFLIIFLPWGGAYYIYQNGSSVLRGFIHSLVPILWTSDVTYISTHNMSQNPPLEHPSPPLDMPTYSSPTYFLLWHFDCHKMRVHVYSFGHRCIVITFSFNVKMISR